ncbi:MAG: phosphatidate cytidylyltransferase [Pseudomonadota bacterium]
MKIGNLAARLGTAAVLAPVVIVSVELRQPEWLWALVFLATMISLHEFFAMTMKDAVERWVGICMGGVAAVVLFFGSDKAFSLALPAVVLCPALFYLFRPRDLPTVNTRAATMSFGVVYAGVLISFVAFLKRDAAPHGAAWVYLVLAIGWLGDTFAYFAGRFLGKRKLYPTISPGKTLAGAVGSVLGSLAAIVAANFWFFPQLGWGHGIVLALVGSILGQSGDLVESMIKRACGVKDSGRLLPGHGGMLDRIDAVMFIAPWVYLYWKLVWRLG